MSRPDSLTFHLGNGVQYSTVYGSLIPTVMSPGRNHTDSPTDRRIELLRVLELLIDPRLWGTTPESFGGKGGGDGLTTVKIDRNATVQRGMGIAPISSCNGPEI
jgi:hypothetical protein